MNGSGDLSWLLFILAVVFIIFLLIREFWCWYWKINLHHDKMDKIIVLLECLDDRIAGKQPDMEQ